MATALDPLDQHSFDVRLDWSIEGLRRLVGSTPVMVIVDVLSFTTCVEVAVSRGAVVFPYRGYDGTEVDFAFARDAVVASRMREGTGERRWSNSPASLMELRAGTRLVLPSPNGSTLAFEAAESGATVLAGCLRNASAVAAAAEGAGVPIGVVAAGERWHGSDGPLRPAVEDLLGAGAVIARLSHLDCSPEALAALAAFDSAREQLDDWITSSASGRELAARGFAEDVRIAAEADVSSTVPRLINGAFRRTQ